MSKADRKPYNKNWPALWERECLISANRNELVIPFILTLLDSLQLSSICDLGCGTGYISREIARRLDDQHTKWTLIDTNKESLDFAARLWPKNKIGQFIHSDISEIPPSEFDLAFSSFSSLEFLVDEKMATSIANSLKNQGLLVWIIPNTIEDILQEKDKHIHLQNLRKSGFTTIKKAKKQTHFLNYPFIIQTMESTVSLFNEAGLALISTRKVFNSQNKSLYIFVFQKHPNLTLSI